MRKLSNELTKSYRVLIILFMFSYVGLMGFFASYIKDVAHADIEAVNSFMNYELHQFGEKIENGRTAEDLFAEAMEECPKIEGVSVIFKYEDKIYPENYSLRILNLTKDETPEDRIKSIGVYRYEYLYKQIQLKNGKFISVIIAKNMKEDREIIFGIIQVSVALIAITLLLSVYISRKFYNKFIPPLKSLQEITNNINLNTLDHKVETKNSFVEFATIITSYENMLKRLKSQTDAQIDFVNNASHELKTPIFIISGYVNLIKRWGFDNKEISQEALDSIEEETKNMSALVSKLLFLAKDNKTDIEYKEIDISEIIENIISDFKVIYPEQEIIFTPKKSIVISDYDLVKQLFINLIENAVKYGLGNKIEVALFHNKNITVEIKDRGAGISKEDLEHIYDKFFRVDKARSRNMGSHGLGLSIVKNITEALNIDLDIESTLGEGTTVRVTLPIS